MICNRGDSKACHLEIFRMGIAAQTYDVTDAHSKASTTQFLGSTPFRFASILFEYVTRSPQRGAQATPSAPLNISGALSVFLFFFSFFRELRMSFFLSRLSVAETYYWGKIHVPAVSKLVTVSARLSL